MIVVENHPIADGSLFFVCGCIGQLNIDNRGRISFVTSYRLV